MKKNLLLMIVAVLLVFSKHNISAQVPAGDEVAPDVGLSLQYDVPGVGDYDLYDSGITAEFQFRDWVRNPWGYSLAIGYGEWSSNRDANNPGSGLYDFSGNLQVVPFGGSVLYRFYQGDEWSFILDTGVRYMAYDSKIRARQEGLDPDKKYGVEVDDSILFSASADADYAINPDLDWTLGLGYRTDITRGELSTELVQGRDSIMESFFLATALRFKL